MKHIMLVGIEHLMTGFILTQNNNGRGFQFVCASPSVVRVESDAPFEGYWPNRVHMQSTPTEVPFKGYFAGDGEIEWWAQVVSPAMSAERKKLFEAQTYTRHANERPGQLLARTEPVGFPPAVVDAMVRKHGKDAHQFLAKLRWAGDHWYYNHDRMYVGVEPDGHIHT